ncbi:MAG: hypothetical protein ACF8PG_04835 [Maioricimonas sp. JB045]
MMRGTEYGRKKKILALLGPAVCVSGLAVSGCARSRDVAVARPEPAADQQSDAESAQEQRELIAQDDALEPTASEAEVRRTGWRRWLSGDSEGEARVAQEAPQTRRSFAKLFADDEAQGGTTDPFVKGQSVQTASAQRAPGVPAQSEPPVQTAQAESPAVAATPSKSTAPAGEQQASREIFDSLMSPPNATEQAALSRPGESVARASAAPFGARPFPQETVSRTDRLRAEVAATESAPAPRSEPRPEPRPEPRARVNQVRFSPAAQEQTRKRVGLLIAQAYRQDSESDTAGALRSLERAIELCNYGGLTFGPGDDDPRELKRRVLHGLRLKPKKAGEAEAAPAGPSADASSATTSPVQQADYGTDSLADEVFDDVFGQHQWRRATDAPESDEAAVPSQSEPDAAADEVDDARPFPMEPPVDPLSAQAEPEMTGDAEPADSPIQLAGIVDVDETEDIVRHAVVEQTDTESLRRVQTVSDESVELSSPLLAEGSYPEFPSRTEQPAPEPLVQLDPQPLYVAPPPPVETTADRSSQLEGGPGAKPGESRSSRSPIVQIALILIGVVGGLGLLFRRRGHKTPTAT